MISVINVVIVLRALKKNEDRKKNDKVILDGMKEILKQTPKVHSKAHTDLEEYVSKPENKISNDRPISAYQSPLSRMEMNRLPKLGEVYHYRKRGHEEEMENRSIISREIEKQKMNFYMDKSDVLMDGEEWMRNN
jgi:hypothetical protein